MCLTIVCGDGVVDRGEVCDDSNTLDGDGCSASCFSNETCGNGVADPAAGEACDDGNGLAHDGCRACQPEPPTWRPVVDDTVAPYPVARKFHALAYDSGPSRLHASKVALGVLDEVVPQRGMIEV